MLHRTLFLFALLLSDICLARDGVFFDLSHRLNYATFVEWDKGIVINKESGELPGYSFSLGYQKPNTFYFEYIHAASENTLDYSGFTQFGNHINALTDYVLESDQYIFGKTIETTVVYLGYEVNTRDRLIYASSSNTSSLTESLKQKQGFIGFKQTVVDSGRWLVDFRFNAKMAFSSYMHVDFDNAYDNSNIHMGLDYTLTTNLYVAKTLPHDWLLGINLIYEYTEIEQSEPVELSRGGDEIGAQFYHPYTELETYSLGFSISKFF